MAVVPVPRNIMDGLAIGAIYLVDRINEMWRVEDEDGNVEYVPIPFLNIAFRVVINAVLYHFLTTLESYDIIVVYIHAVCFTIFWCVRTHDRNNESMPLLIFLCFTISYVSSTFGYIHMSICSIIMLLLTLFEPVYIFQLYMFGKRCLDIVLSANKSNLTNYLHSGSYKVSSKVTNILSVCVFLYLVFINPSPRFPRPEDRVWIAGVLTPIFVLAVLIIISNLIYSS